MRSPLSTLFLLAVFLGSCAPQPVTATPTSPATALPSSTPIPSPSRTPLPPPTRRVAAETATSAASPIPSLTALPEPQVYVFPLQPPQAATYGEGTQGHGYPATDLFAPVGTQFVAVTDGVIEFVSSRDAWNPNKPDPNQRSGLAVALLGDDGWRYYGSHLSAVAAGIYPGLRVKPGQLLGYVGASGDAVGKTPHLHFGISHPTYPTDWKTRRGEIDPFPYLNWWKEGHNVTPAGP